MLLPDTDIPNDLQHIRSELTSHQHLDATNKIPKIGCTHRKPYVQPEICPRGEDPVHNSQETDNPPPPSSVRNADQLTTYLSLSSSSRRPLLTLWTTSWCTTCHQVSPLVKSLIESGVGEAEGGVTYAEIEYDAPDVMTEGLGLTYMINSVPTLLSFDAGEAQVETKVVDGNLLKDRRFVEEWIRKEARRHGGRGGGGGGAGGGLFGGLFGSFKG